MPNQGTEVKGIGFQWHNDKAVLGDAEQGPLHFFHSDQAVRQSADINFSADGIATWKKFCGNVSPYVGHARCAVSFGICKETTVRDSSVVDVGRVRRGANYDYILESLIVALYQ